MMIIFMLSSTAFAEGRWVPIEGEEGFYVDSKTAIYDEATNSIYFWTKFEYKHVLENMEYQHVNINEAKVCLIKNAFYGGKKHPKVTTYDDDPHLDIMPDDILEKASNIVCDIYGAPHMYSNCGERWKYLYSADEYEIYYAPEIVHVDRDKNIVVIYTKGKLQDGKNTSTMKWICNFNNSSLESISFWGTQKKYILPDTLEEAVWEIARTYID